MRGRWRTRRAGVVLRPRRKADTGSEPDRVRAALPKQRVLSNPPEELDPLAVRLHVVCVCVRVNVFFFFFSFGAVQTGYALMRDDETLDELQRSLRATHDPAWKIRPRSRDCGEIQKSTTGREKKKKTNSDTRWAAVGRHACHPKKKKKRRHFFEGNQDLQASETLLRANATGRANPGRRRRCSWENSDKTNRDNFHQSRSRIHKDPAAVSPPSHLLANKIPSARQWSDSLILKLSSLGPISTPGWDEYSAGGADFNLRRQPCRMNK